MGGTPLIDRRSAVKTLLADRGALLVVSGLGAPTWDVHAAGDADANFYLWGAMGSAALIGLGLAQAQPGRKVLVITGDGEQLMAMGGMATVAIAKPTNLVIVVLDNGHYGETGMQRSHTGLGLDLAAVARACGFTEAGTISDPEHVAELRRAIHETADGPRLYVLKVKADDLAKSLPPRDAVHLRNRFRAALGFAAS